jgi:hypothetical protein
MNLATIEPALVAWVRTLLGFAASDPVVFENQRRPADNGRIAILSWVASAGVGVDEVRWEDNEAPAPAPNLVPVVCGVRTLTLQVAVETLDQTSGATARAALELLRARLRRPSSLAALAAANLGLIGAEAVTSADYRVNQRLRSRALLEVRFNATSHDRDETGAGPAIESVDVTSHLTGTDGVELDASLQMSTEVIP